MHLMKCIRVLISLRVSLRSNAIPSQTQASSISQSVEDMTFSIDSANSVASFLRAALCRSVRATHSLCCVRPSSVFSLCSRQTFDNLTKPSRSLWDSWSPPNLLSSPASRTCICQYARVVSLLNESLTQRIGRSLPRTIKWNIRAARPAANLKRKGKQRIS